MSAVLVVEDDPALRELYRSTLTLAGYFSRCRRRWDRRVTPRGT